MRRVSLEEAIGQIQSGQRVLVPPGCGHPTALARELGNQAARFKELTIVGGLSLSSAPWLDERFPNLRFVTYHVSGPVREAFARGQAKYVPLRYSETIRVFSRGGALAPDAVLLQVAPPDKEGRYSLGVSVSYSLPAARTAPVVIAQLNPKMPRTLGNGFLREDEIDFLTEADEPLVAYEPAPMGEVETKIASFVEKLIPDGATIQTGLGAVPEGLLSFLKGKKNLRLHSLLVDSAIGLMKSGAVKNGPEGTSICEIMGTEKLFSFSHENPGVFMEDSSVVHDVTRVAKIPRFVSILSALEIDLTGQVAAESAGGKLLAGIGGQLDFAMASAVSEDAVCIVALPSTGGKNGEKSKIVPRLAPGTAVTTPRSLVRYVATEHGIADLRGLDLEARAKALCRIAHPRFREELEQAAKEGGAF
ncbi:MAG: acetyl-CoA hydrolase/transferase C-terminal domain-containing protein [Bdellovibrionota bacterium]